VAQIICTHVSKCKNDKIKEKALIKSAKKEIKRILEGTSFVS
jgi:hypothetical protein